MRAIALIVLSGFLLALGGCASTSEPQDPNRVSNIPWNKPERWEGTGPFGSMMPGAGGY
jgi:hypothetical protein